jgi:WD repeat-containing protein 48
MGSLQRSNAPGNISLPVSDEQSSSTISPGAVTTPKANEVNRWPMTPGLAIGMATPSIATASGAPQSAATPSMATTMEEAGTSLSRRTSKQSQPPTMTEKHSNDYFSPSANNGQSETSSENTKVTVPTTPGEIPSTPALPTSPTDEKEDGKKKGLFGKKFGMTFPKNLGRKSVEVKQLTNTEEKTEVESDKSSDKEEKLIEHNFLSVIQKIRQDYDEQLEASPEKPLLMSITPSLPNETPVLKPPPHTLIIIQEDNPESGGLLDLYRGEISRLGKEADIVEKIAPMWLGDLLLKV